MALSQQAQGKVSIPQLRPLIERFMCSFISRKGSPAPFADGTGEVDILKWRKLDSRKLGVARSMISLSSWIVLKNLQNAGFEAYLVGGCVRDFVLNRVPKDFDVITTARLREVKKKFQRAIIVGKRFPVCRVLIKGTVVEVSSFETAEELTRKKQVPVPKMPKGCDRKDFARWKDCMQRDFTINSLLFDPFVNTIFDYTDAIMDLRSLKLRTVKPAQFSFEEDKARILRGLRLAARLNLSFSKETEDAMLNLSSSVVGISTSRIVLEIDYMLSYGAAAPSLLLLKRFNLLEILLPFQDAYLSEMANSPLAPHSLLLMKLLSNMDKVISCDRPCDSCLWIALLSFHVALFNNPQPAVVVLTLASLLHHKIWEESIKFARKNAHAAKIYYPEILDTFEYLPDDEIAERVSRFFVQLKDSVEVFNKKGCLLHAMDRFQKFPHSCLFFISKNMGDRVERVFRIFAKDVTSINTKKRGPSIDHRLLKEGNTDEIRFVLGKILMDTLFCGDSELTQSKIDCTQVIDPPQKAKVLEQVHDTSKHLIAGDDFMVKNNKKRNLPPSNSKLFPDNAGEVPKMLNMPKEKHHLSEDKKETGCESADLSSHSLSSDKVEKDQQFKDKKRNGISLSSLFK